MLTIRLSPIRSNDNPLTVSWIAPVLTINDVAYDLSLLPDGATAEHPVLGNVTRNADAYSVVLALPHGPNAPHATRFPVDVVMTADGVVPIPPYDEVV